MKDRLRHDLSIAQGSPYQRCRCRGSQEAQSPEGYMWAWMAQHSRSGPVAEQVVLEQPVAIHCGRIWSELESFGKKSALQGSSQTTEGIWSCRTTAVLIPDLQGVSSSLQHRKAVVQLV